MSLLALRRWEGLELSVGPSLVWFRGIWLPSPTGAPGAEFLVGAAVPQLELGACPQLLCSCWGHESALSKAGFVFLLYLGFVAKLCCSSTCKHILRGKPASKCKLGFVLVCD